MKPSTLIPIPAGSPAGPLDLAHNLGRIPYAAVPLAQSPGLVRLRTSPAAYDAQFIYLYLSDPGLAGVVVVW